jgi:hypothetical protein
MVLASTPPDASEYLFFRLGRVSTQYNLDVLGRADAPPSNVQILRTRVESRTKMVKRYTAHCYKGTHDRSNSKRYPYIATKPSIQGTMSESGHISRLLEQYNADFANGLHFDAKFPLHDVDTGHGRRFGARQVWRGKSVSDKSTTSESAVFRLDESGHILASAALVTPWSQPSSCLSATRREAPSDFRISCLQGQVACFRGVLSCQSLPRLWVGCQLYMKTS